MKSAIIGVIFFILGCVATGLFVSKGMDLIDEEQLVYFQHAELVKGTLVAGGQYEKVITLIRSYIEHEICRDASMQALYAEEKHRKTISKEIQRFYFALNEEPPDHVAKWLEDGALTYEDVDDAFSVWRQDQGQNESEIYCTRIYRNVSNISWKELIATAYLYDADENVIGEKQIELNQVVNPQNDATFTFVFEKPTPVQESLSDSFDIDVILEGTKVE